MGKLDLRSYQWTSPPAVAFTAFADAWPRTIETEIGAALCAIGRGKGLLLFLTYAVVCTDFAFLPTPALHNY